MVDALFKSRIVEGTVGGRTLQAKGQFLEFAREWMKRIHVLPLSPLPVENPLVQSTLSPHLNNHYHILNDAVGFLSLLHIPNAGLLKSVPGALDRYHRGG